MIARRALFIAAILMMLFVRPASAQVDCSQCHPDLAQGKSVHAAVAMGCDSCHSAIHAVAGFTSTKLSMIDSLDDRFCIE